MLNSTLSFEINNSLLPSCLLPGCFLLALIALICFSPWYPIVFACFSKTFPKGEYANLAYSIIYLWLEGNISSPVGYPCVSIFPDDKADIFAASLLISYCRFSSQILSSIAMISFYILFERFFQKRKGARVASRTKNEYGFAKHFLKRFIKSLKPIYDECN